MRKWLFLLTLPLFFLLFNCSAPVVPVTYDIQGTVKLWNNTALENVTITAGTKTATTDSNGNWSITGLSGIVTVSAQLNNYHIVVSGTVSTTRQVSSNTTINFTAYSTTESFAGGTGTQDDPYIIVTANQLNNIRNNLDKHFKQIKDIDLNDLKVKLDPIEANWEPVGHDFPVNPGPFTGNYDGMGFEIQNMVVVSEIDGYSGFFAVISEATIKNIVFRNAQIDCDASYSGIFAGYIYNSIIDNIIIKNSSISKSTYIGGFVGYTDSSTITNCKIQDTRLEADPDSGGFYLGGFVADAGATWFENCTITNIQITGSNSSQMIGGFVGSSSISGFKNCSFEGTIDAKGTYVGGFVGYSEWHEEELGKMAFDTFENCSVKGQMYARRNDMSGYVGGFAGCMQDVPNFMNCTVQMNITVDLNATTVAGFVGTIDGSKEVSILRCSFEGTIDASDDFIDVSGFGFVFSKASFDQCYTRFEIQTGAHANISGFLNLIGDISDVSITNSYAKGTVNSESDSKSAGFIMMSSFIHPTVEKCYCAVENVGCAFLYNFEQVTTTDCFYDLDICDPVDDFSTASGKTTTQMKDQTTFTSWDFNNLWAISSTINDGYPHLKWEN